MQRAELATAAKSRFLAAASHDLRQPLQTLKLIQGLLAKKAQGEATQELVGVNPTLSAMSGMLNTLLDMDRMANSGKSKSKYVTFGLTICLADYATNSLIMRTRVAWASMWFPAGFPSAATNVCLSGSSVTCCRTH